MSDNLDTILALSQSLRNDRLIQIFVGEDADPENNTAKPFFVQETLLHGISEYFVAATKHEHLGTGNAGILRFPEDLKDAWELLLYWLFTGHVPHKVRDQADQTVSSLCLVNCYVLADRLIIPSLQNEIMIELIFRRETSNMPQEAARQALMTVPSASPLCMLVMQDLMAQVGCGVLSITELERVLDGIPGTTGPLLTASAWRVPTQQCPWRLFRRSRLWQSYMVGGDHAYAYWPYKHWMWDENHLGAEQRKSDAQFPGR